MYECVIGRFIFGRQIGNLYLVYIKRIRCAFLLFAVLMAMMTKMAIKNYKCYKSFGINATKNVTTCNHITGKTHLALSLQCTYNLFSALILVDTSKNRTVITGTRLWPPQKTVSVRADLSTWGFQPQPKHIDLVEDQNTGWKQQRRTSNKRQNVIKYQ